MEVEVHCMYELELIIEYYTFTRGLIHAPELTELLDMMIEGYILSYSNVLLHQYFKLSI